MPDIDRSVIEGLRRGEDAAYKAVVDSLLAHVYRFLLRLTGSASLAEDLTQETFLAVWQGIGAFKGEAKFKTWVFGIAYHQFLRYRDKRVVETVQLDESRVQADASNSDELMMQADESARIRHAIQDLPEMYREVFCLIHLEGLNYREAAQVLEMRIGTVKSRMNVAFKLLREKLGEGKVEGNEVREPESLPGW